MKLSLLRAVGEKREKDFNKLGIFEAEDLVRFYPRAYLDLTERSSLRGAYHNDMALVACEVVQVAPVNYMSRLKPVKAYCNQDGLPFTVVWFNQPYVRDKLKAGEYLFYGRVQNKYGQISLVNPTFEPLDKNYRLKGIVPVYSLKGSLSQKIVRDAVKEALQKAKIDSVIPPQIIEKYGLAPLEKCYFDIHNPPDMAAKDSAAERIATEEYFVLISAFKLIKGDKEDVRIHKYSVTAAQVKEFALRFGFEFTDGQKRAVNEIFENLHSPSRMNRLLQGDVGSGKTAVALCGIYMAVKSGLRAAYLSPTEVLAAQNFALLEKYYPECRVGYLAGGKTAREKRELKARLRGGEIDIVCGTHAMLQGDVEIPDLGFIVCDEQHRFGVAQRNALAEKERARTAGDERDAHSQNAVADFTATDITTISDAQGGRRWRRALFPKPLRRYADHIGRKRAGNRRISLRENRRGRRGGDAYQREGAVRGAEKPSALRQVRSAARPHEG
ncbi:MAG: DEAD/DEAH box helicase [Christensenellaceae bacterium]